MSYLRGITAIVFRYWRKSFCFREWVQIVCRAALWSAILYDALYFCQISLGIKNIHRIWNSTRYLFDENSGTVPTKKMWEICLNWKEISSVIECRYCKHFVWGFYFTVLCLGQFCRDLISWCYDGGGRQYWKPNIYYLVIHCTYYYYYSLEIHKL